MPRNKYPEETVQKILDASMKQFLEKGYDETTILDIVDSLGGLTRGAFYHHFKSKEEVLDALGDRMFYENNPFEKVKLEKGLNGLEKIKKVMKMQLEDNDQQEIGMMSIPLLKNPRILAAHLENNQKIIAPLVEELFKEAVLDGSIKNIKYTKPLSEMFTFITNIWLIPSVFPCSKEEVAEKLLFSKELFDQLGIPVIDQEILDYTMQVLEQIETE